MVAKLAAARKRMREAKGKCEGRKSYAELRPDVVALVKKLRRRKPKGGQMSLRAISGELAARVIRVGSTTSARCPVKG